MSRKNKKKKNLYEELGVEPTASKEEIKRAYRKRSKKVHPDVNKSPDAAEEFKRLTQAYVILYDDQARYKYDSTGEEEKPSDRKEVNIDEQGKMFLLKTIFSLVDKLGENFSKKNVQNHTIAALKEVRKEVKQRMANTKAQWRFIRKKKAAVESKQAIIQRGCLLDEILKIKLEHINRQELIPTKEEYRKLITDLKIIDKALNLAANDCIDTTIEEKETNPYQSWDSAMNAFNVSFDTGTTWSSTGPF